MFNICVHLCSSVFICVHLWIMVFYLPVLANIYFFMKISECPHTAIQMKNMRGANQILYVRLNTDHYNMPYCSAV